MQKGTRYEQTRTVAALKEAGYKEAHYSYGVVWLWKRCYGWLRIGTTGEIRSVKRDAVPERALRFMQAYHTRDNRNIRPKDEGVPKEERGSRYYVLYKYRR
jgi:hypothetical protein